MCMCDRDLLGSALQFTLLFVSDQQNQIHCSPTDFCILWYVNIIARCCLFYKIQVNVKMWKFSRYQNTEFQEDLIIQGFDNNTGKVRDGKKGKM